MHNYSDSVDVKASPVQNISNLDAFSISVSAPGKVILFGEHSVVYGKLAVAAGLGLRTKLTFVEQEPTEMGTSKVNINLHDVNLMHCYDLEDLQSNLFKKNEDFIKNVTLEKPETAHHEDLLVAIEEFISKHRGTMALTAVQHNALVSLFYLLTVMIGAANFNLKPFNLTITSDLTIGAGLGSSASYSVVIAAAFLEYVRFKTGKKKESCKKAANKKDLELISKWSFSAERIIHGTPSGLDNTICTYGSLVEFRKNSLIKPLDLKHKLQVLLIDSKVPKDTKVQVAKVSSLKQTYPPVIENILCAMESISNLALLDFLKLNEVSASSKLTSGERQRKVDEVYEHLSDLVNLNQNLLRTLTVSHPCLDDICAILAEEGLRGKLTGGGGGGYAFTIVPPSFSKTILQKVLAKLNSKGYETILTDLGGPGLLFS